MSASADRTVLIHHAALGTVQAVEIGVEDEEQVSASPDRLHHGAAGGEPGCVDLDRLSESSGPPPVSKPGNRQVEGKPSVEAMSTVMPGRTEHVHQRSFVQHRLLVPDDASGCVQERPASQVPRVAKSGHLIVGSQEEPEALLVGQRSDHRLELMPRRIRETPRMHLSGHGRDDTIGHFAADG